MRQNLLETYSRQLKVAEAYVAKNFDGKTISANTQLTTAVLLDNTNRWMTESLDPTTATERADLGAWKKFCLNLTNIAVPSLIANDLVIVHPMTSYSGSVAYLEYVAKSEKGGVHKGDVFNGVFGLGEVGESRTQYSSQVIVESMESGAPTLTPVKDGLHYTATEVIHGREAEVIKHATFKSVLADGSVEYGESPADGAVKIAYVSEEFQMEHVPATDIPTIGPVMKRIPLVAEPRRIAVRYDQITAFQAKTDYGFSLDKQIAEQACGELAFEIDCEIVNMLHDEAFKKGNVVLSWDKTLPVGVSKFEHYNGFLEVIEEAKAEIYRRTKKFSANYMVCAADVLPVLSFVNGFSAVKAPKMNGPYKAGELNGLEVFVSPSLAKGEFFLGLNGSDMMSSAGVYAPYMAIVPTQLLGTPDGGLAQGFSTWYSKAILNGNLLVAGHIEGGFDDKYQYKAD
jgi:hypothetical protein